MIRSRLRLFVQSLRSVPVPAPAARSASGFERLLAIRDLQLGAVRGALASSRTGTEGLGTAVARLVFELDQAKAAIAADTVTRASCTAHSRDCPFQS